jgi:large subunit ribosomal protein L23
MENIIIKPVITEKSLQEAQSGKYTFIVARFANKNQIRQAVEELFGVKTTKAYVNVVKGVNTRLTRKGRNSVDMTYKKARVQVAKGQKISLFDETKE